MLKVDRSFVSRLSKTDENSDVFVKMIVILARTLGMEVVAEGVETEEQLRIMQQLRCEFGQGYLFSKPLDQAEFAALMYRESLCQNTHRKADDDSDDFSAADHSRHLNPIEVE